MILIVNVTVQAIEKFNCCDLHRVDPLHEYRETLERQAYVLEATVLRWNLKKKSLGRLSNFSSISIPLSVFRPIAAAVPVLLPGSKHAPPANFG